MVIIEIERYIPSLKLRPFIHNFFFFEIPENQILLAKQGLTVLPTPYVSMILFFSEPSFKIADNDTVQLHDFSLTGFNTCAKNYTRSSSLKQMIVCFTPIGIQHFLNFPLKEISDTHGHVKLVFPNYYDMLLNELNNANNNKKRVEIVESFYIKKLNKSKTLDERIYPLVNYILRTNGTDNLKKVAKETALGERTIQRLMHHYVGINYKSFSTLVRFKYAQSLLNANQENLTSIGLQAGYFDQAHFINDFKELSGFTPGEYLRKNHSIIWNKIDNNNLAEYNDKF